MAVGFHHPRPRPDPCPSSRRRRQGCELLPHANCKTTSLASTSSWRTSQGDHIVMGFVTPSSSPCQNFQKRSSIWGRSQLARAQNHRNKSAVFPVVCDPQQAVAARIQRAAASPPKAGTRRCPPCPARALALYAAAFTNCS